MHKAKTTLSQLVAEAEAGEDVVIMRDDVPAVRLVPVNRRKPTRVFGALAGKLKVTSDFFAPLPESELTQWEG
jgi:antitoxin (DNA-binding transcriptional repressor) of toxin-antitoxin stability system